MYIHFPLLMNKQTICVNLNVYQVWSFVFILQLWKHLIWLLNPKLKFSTAGKRQAKEKQFSTPSQRAPCMFTKRLKVGAQQMGHSKKSGKLNLVLYCLFSHFPVFQTPCCLFTLNFHSFFYALLFCLRFHLKPTQILCTQNTQQINSINSSQDKRIKLLCRVAREQINSYKKRRAKKIFFCKKNV